MLPDPGIEPWSPTLQAILYHLSHKTIMFYTLENVIRVDLMLSVEEAMAPHSSTLAWKIPRMQEPGRLQYKAGAPSFESLFWRLLECGE